MVKKWQGVFASGLMFTVVAWCVRARGPLFVSIFQPLMLVMVGLMGSLFLEEKLHLGMYVFIFNFCLLVLVWSPSKFNVQSDYELFLSLIKLLSDKRLFLTL